ncbi:hypothetical protein M514_20148 [Trichuris suis]|uniref:Uncharacterized protein n=1 Tax=Trichuris suis TaxID=68888 RepID=A0A085NDV6_9BILA|nr:hypothetical protein M514_20148 [Trichuris suis]
MHAIRLCKGAQPTNLDILDAPEDELKFGKTPEKRFKERAVVEIFFRERIGTNEMQCRLQNIYKEKLLWYEYRQKLDEENREDSFRE